MEQRYYNGALPRNKEKEVLMSVFKIYGVKKWFIISLIAIAVIWCLFGVSLFFYINQRQTILLYLSIFLGLYGLASFYVLLKQSVFRFLSISKKEGTKMEGTITYQIPSSSETSERPLFVYEEKGVKKAAALIGIFGFNVKKRFPTGKKVKAFKIKGETNALLMNED